MYAAVFQLPKVTYFAVHALYRQPHKLSGQGCWVLLCQSEIKNEVLVEITVQVISVQRLEDLAYFEKSPPNHVWWCCAQGGPRPVGAISPKLVVMPPAPGSGKAIFGPVGSSLLIRAICVGNISLSKDYFAQIEDGLYFMQSLYHKLTVDVLSSTKWNNYNTWSMHCH